MEETGFTACCCSASHLVWHNVKLFWLHLMPNHSLKSIIQHFATLIPLISGNNRKIYVYFKWQSCHYFSLQCHMILQNFYYILWRMYIFCFPVHWLYGAVVGCQGIAKWLLGGSGWFLGHAKWLLRCCGWILTGSGQKVYGSVHHTDCSKRSAC